MSRYELATVVLWLTLIIAAGYGAGEDAGLLLGAF